MLTLIKHAVSSGTAPDLRLMAAYPLTMSHLLAFLPLNCSFLVHFFFLFFVLHSKFIAVLVDFKVCLDLLCRRPLWWAHSCACAHFHKTGFHLFHKNAQNYMISRQRQWERMTQTHKNKREMSKTQAKLIGAPNTIKGKQPTQEAWPQRRQTINKK